MNKLFFIFFIFFTMNLSSQELVDLNLIIIVNEEIKPGSIGVKLKYNLKDGNPRIIDVDYVPGSLKIKKEFLDEINMDSTNVVIEIRYNLICMNKSYNSIYVIEDLNFSLLQEYFFILQIYDTKFKKYSKLYENILGKNFTYEYNSPKGYVRRLQKNKVKQGDCQ